MVHYGKNSTSASKRRNYGGGRGALYKKILPRGLGNIGKNKKHISNLIGKGLDAVYSDYRIEGLNLSALLNKLKKSEVGVYRLRFVSQNAVTLRVKVIDEQKFFAIIDNLCYNVKKIKNSGKLLPLYKLLLSPSILLGVAVFIAVCISLSGIIMGVSFSGSGVRYKDRVANYLVDRGVVKKTSFHCVNLDELSNDILSAFNEFSFVSCAKRGNMLLIELVLAENKTHVESNSEPNLYSNCAGVVEEVKVYRGTANVKVGDEVNVGDALVFGFMEIKGKRVEVNALAVITIRASKQFSYITECENNEEEVTAFAIASLGEECLETLVDKEEKNGKYYYKVTVYYKRVIYTG